MRCRYLFKTVTSFLSILCPEVGMLDLMIVILLAFRGLSILFSIVVVSVYIPTNERGFPLLTSSPAIIVYRYFDDGYSLVTLMVRNPPLMQETQAQSLSREDPIEKEIATHSSICA